MVDQEELSDKKCYVVQVRAQENLGEWRASIVEQAKAVLFGDGLVDDYL